MIQSSTYLDSNTYAGSTESVVVIWGGTNDIMAVYLKSFIAGMDMLMIPGSRFAAAITYFRAVYDNELTDAQKKLAIKKIGGDWNSIHAAFLARAQESLARIDRTRALAVQAPSDANVVPTSETVKERADYFGGLLKIDKMWKGHLPSESSLP